ncbi:hypothetical protein GVO57_06355 [Sphingomonas changnyeongensis]|uniref:Outer membrane protein beta-barrel domain-containing protein n=1 Tax=Sphingomonas changnyeongensis TaxID=2698679 RepID=A0A7Z2NVE9_9SPHN|nr:hypothetical protein [Sphingomonas changnyeongensis]QHL90533.1 hypothetical protein GVO57_06355 [Sphingomonas changnyeongensis]
MQLNNMCREAKGRAHMMLKAAIAVAIAVTSSPCLAQVDAALFAGAHVGASAGAVAEDLVGGVDRTRSFILRGGAELALSKTVGVRLEFEHLDGSRNGLMLGMPIRF